MESLTVIVPFYNEARTIPTLTMLLNEVYGRVPFECLFIDDGSTDNSLLLLKDSLENVAFSYRIISHENRGKAGAIQTASQVLNTSHCVIMDSDLELDVSSIATAWDIIQKRRFEAVFGYRDFRSHSSFTFRYSRGNQFISNWYGLFFNVVISDVMCGFKLIPSFILRGLPFTQSRFAVEIEIASELWKYGLKPYEIHIEYQPRTRAEGKVIGIPDAIKVLWAILWLRLRLRRNCNDV